MPRANRVRVGVVAVATACLIGAAGCGPATHATGPTGTASPARSGATAGGSAAPRATYAGGWPRGGGDHPGRPVEITSDSGFRYTLNSLGGGLAPQHGTDSAPPGRKFPFVVLLAHNEQTDRTAAFTFGVDLWITVPKGAGFEQDTGTCVGSVTAGSCGEHVVCDYQTDPNGPGLRLDVADATSDANVMAAGATWRMTCWPGADDATYSIADTVDPTRIRLFRKTDLVTETYQEIRPGA